MHAFFYVGIQKFPKSVVSRILQSSVLCKLHDRNGTIDSVTKGEFFKNNEISQ